MEPGKIAVNSSGAGYPADCGMVRSFAIIVGAVRDVVPQ
jgi:hypothetical protein